MSAFERAERVLIAKIAAHAKWAKTPNRAAATAAARKAALDRFEREVDPDGVMSPTERARCAESARRQYFAKLALKSAQSRRVRRKGAAFEAEIEAALSARHEDGAA